MLLVESDPVISSLRSEPKKKPLELPLEAQALLELRSLPHPKEKEAEGVEEEVREEDDEEGENEDGFDL